MAFKILPSTNMCIITYIVFDIYRHNVTKPILKIHSFWCSNENIEFMAKQKLVMEMKSLKYTYTCLFVYKVYRNSHFCRISCLLLKLRKYDKHKSTKGLLKASFKYSVLNWNHGEKCFCYWNSNSIWPRIFFCLFLILFLHGLNWFLFWVRGAECEWKSVFIYN